MNSSSEQESQSDIWYDWLLHHRHADNLEYDKVVKTDVERYADRVLDGAKLTEGMILADIGTGQGLIAFRAIERIGSSLCVLLTDISIPLLRHTEKIAIQSEIQHQCTFLQCSADNLKEIEDASVDAVTTRAVLAYVLDKQRALNEFNRILKPGGRISICEPILQDDAYVANALRKTVEEQTPESENLFMSLLHRWKASQFPDTEEKISKSPITNYSERDLVGFARNAGFVDIHLEFHIDIIQSKNPSWEVFMDISPHPLAPSLRTILTEKFTLEERQFFEQILRPTIETSQAVSIERIAYLTASKLV